MGILRRVTGNAAPHIQSQRSAFPLPTIDPHNTTYLVPALLTRGSATHCSVAEHGESSNLLPTHCASWPLTHAVSPDVHGELAVSPLNCWLSFCASSPFWSVNAARRSTLSLFWICSSAQRFPSRNIHLRTVVLIRLCYAPRHRPRAYPLGHRWHQWQQYDLGHLVLCHR